jgi:hypothetical protein
MMFPFFMLLLAGSLGFVVGWVGCLIHHWWKRHNRARAEEGGE